MENRWVSGKIFIRVALNFSGHSALATFTDEEGYGRFLDLHQSYEVYLNIKGLEVTLPSSPIDSEHRSSLSLQKLDYLSYLQEFDRLYKISKDQKSHDYRQYLSEHLFPYLFDFLQRCKPLININKDLLHIRQEFELKWEQGIFPGWPVSLTNKPSHLSLPLSFSERDRWGTG